MCFSQHSVKKVKTSHITTFADEVIQYTRSAIQIFCYQSTGGCLVFLIQKFEGCISCLVIGNCQMMTR